MYNDAEISFIILNLFSVEIDYEIEREKEILKNLGSVHNSDKSGG